MRSIAFALAVAGLLSLGACERAPEAGPTESAAATAPVPSVVPSAAPPAPSETPEASTPAPAAPASPPSSIPARLQALGTEPFWNVRIDGARLVYTTPEDQKGQAIAATRDDTSVASTWTGKLGGKPFEVSIVPEKCSDGMSDTEYPFSAWLKFNGATRHGCARAAR